jgi:peptidoglycan/xylan/chitin deacetylase (PgdA/CDA1 family)
MVLIVWLGLFVCAVFGVWILLPYAYRKLKVSRLNRLCRSSGTIVLTYDDGPSKNFTDKLLELLGEYKATATFFILGWRLEQNTDVLNRILADGHEVGSHSQNHLNAWTAPPWAVAKDIRAGISGIEKLGVTTHLFRPPNGKITLATLFQSWMNKKDLAWWTIDSTDTHPETLTGAELAESVRKAGGGVVLLHDFERTDNPDRNDFVFEATRSLLDMAKREKLNICTFGELTGERNVADRSS